MSRPRKSAALLKQASDSSNSDASSVSSTTLKKRARSGTIVPATNSTHRSRRDTATGPAVKRPRHATESDSSLDSNSESATPSADPQSNDDDEGEEADSDATPESLEHAERRLARKIEKTTAKTYEHFVMPPTLKFNSKTKVYDHVFVCRFNESINVRRKPSDSSTSNLKRHIAICSEAPGFRQTTLDSISLQTTFSVGRFRALWVKEVTLCHRPLVIATDGPLVEMADMFRRGTGSPGPTIIKRDMKDGFELTRTKLRNDVLATEFAKHLMFDGWASASRRSFMGVGVAFFNGNNIDFKHLDLIPLRESHTAIYLARKIYECAEFYNIIPQLLGMIGDNHNVNPKLVDVLVSRHLGDDTMVGVDSFVGCGGHQVDLGVRAGMGLVVGKKEIRGVPDFADEDDDLNDHSYDDMPDLEEVDFMDGIDTLTEKEEEERLEELLSELEEMKQLTDAEIALGRRAFNKILRLGRRVYNSTILTDRLAVLCDEVGIPSKRMVRAVATRWVSILPVVQRGIYLEKPLSRLVHEDEFNKDRKRRLDRYSLMPDEMRVLKEVVKLLELASLAIKHMSQSAVALIWQVIPVHDTYIDELDRIIVDRNYLKVTRAIASRMRAVALKYYSKTDDNKVMRIAMILIPFYKTTYFVRHGWEDEWVATALDLIRAEWNNRYKPLASDVEASGDNDRNLSSFGKSHNPFANIASISYGDQAHNTDALEAYLETPVLSNAVDPVQYWKMTLDQPGAPRTQTGQLATMALNYLSIPATSTDIERMFSHAGLTVTPRRENLAEETTRELVMMGRWFASDDVPMEAFVDLINGKKSRKGKEKEVDESN